jgi:hypothetical protein
MLYADTVGRARRLAVHPHGFAAAVTAFAAE